MGKGYKWIAREIDRLDPEVDYERIWALTSIYYANRFVLNLLYTTGVAKVLLNSEAAATLVRGGQGPIMVDGQRRQTETIGYFLRWFELGPSHPDTQRSVRQVNTMHAAIARKMPGHFAHHDDYTYTLCILGADQHRVRRRVGLPGLRENQQIATHHFCRDLANLFRVESVADGRFTEKVGAFPADFAGMLDFMSRYEAVGWDKPEDGRAACEALIDQFNHRWLPAPLHPVGRSVILALIGQPWCRVYGLRPPPAAVVRLCEITLRAVVLATERVLPDPRSSYPERQRRRARGLRRRSDRERVGVGTAGG